MLFKSYLYDRRQCVRMDGQCSEWLPVLPGVPQGSILGPLLFTIYINDLPSFISFSSILLFADDTKLSQQVSSPSDCAHLQWDINALQQWCFESGLSFNTTKCFVLRFCTSSLFHTDYVLHGSVLKSVSSGRDLGVTFSDDLSWSLHYQAISRSAYSQLSLLRRTFSASCPTSVKKLLCLTLVHSKLTYCSQLWQPSTICDIIQLERIQRRATKFIVDNRSLSYRYRLLSLNLLPLMYHYEMLDVMFFVQCLKFPDDGFNILDHITFSDMPTRSGSKAKLIFHCTSSNRGRHFYFNQ